MNIFNKDDLSGLSGNHTADFNTATTRQIKKKMGWNYEITRVADHRYRPLFKIHRRLEEIVGLQITNPDLKGKENEIPFPPEKDVSQADFSIDLLVCKNPSRISNLKLL